MLLHADIMSNNVYSTKATSTTLLPTTTATTPPAPTTTAPTTAILPILVSSFSRYYCRLLLMLHLLPATAYSDEARARRGPCPDNRRPGIKHGTTLATV